MVQSRCRVVKSFATGHFGDHDRVPFVPDFVFQKAPEAFDNNSGTGHTANSFDFLL